MKKMPTKTPYAILGMLSIAPMSGYDMRRIMQDSTVNFWSESNGQLYPTLENLNKQELITCKLSKKSKGRDKKIYAITPSGKKVLKQWLAQEAETYVVRNEAMLKLFFGANSSPEINKENIETQRYKAKVMQSHLLKTKQQLAQDFKDFPHLPYCFMTIDYGIQMTEAKIMWCDDTIKILEKLNQEKKI